MGRQSVEDVVVSVVSDLRGTRVAVDAKLTPDESVQALMAAEDELGIAVSCPNAVRNCGLAVDVVPDTPSGIISLVEQQIARG